MASDEPFLIAPITFGPSLTVSFESPEMSIAEQSPGKLEINAVICESDDLWKIGTILVDLKYKADKEIGIVSGLAVLTPFRKQGLGERLLLEAEERVRSNGLKTMELSASPALQGFYEKLGFKLMEKLLQDECEPGANPLFYKPIHSKGNLLFHRRCKNC